MVDTLEQASKLANDTGRPAAIATKRRAGLDDDTVRVMSLDEFDPAYNLFLAMVIYPVDWRYVPPEKRV